MYMTAYCYVCVLCAYFMFSYCISFHILTQVVVLCPKLYHLKDNDVT
jgi:hypothetical protein